MQILKTKVSRNLNLSTYLEINRIGILILNKEKNNFGYNYRF